MTKAPLYTVFLALCCFHELSAGFLTELDGSRFEPNEQVRYNGLPNVSARSAAVEIFSDVLVWTAKESATENWAQIFQGVNAQTRTDNIDVLDVPFGWDVGVRVGFDYALQHDQWDTQFSYTWFRTQGSDRASTQNGQVTSSFIGNFFVGNADGSKDVGATYRSASIDWTILFNVIDAEIGRKYLVSSALSLRPFIGLKGGWIYQTIHTDWEYPLASQSIPNPEALGVATENLKNNFWGIGPSIGLNTKWKLKDLNRHAFNLFGDFSGAILYGHWTLKDVYKNQLPQEVSNDMSDTDGAASMIRTFMGLGWDGKLQKKRAHISLRLGYETQVWLDQLQFYSFNVGRLDNLLSLQGGTIDFLIQF